MVIVLKSLVITSDNSGLFFGKESHVIIDHQTLKLMLAKCDGDMAYVLECFKRMNEWCDQGAKVVQTTARVGNRTVTYDGVGIQSLLGFGQNEYKSTGIDKQMLRDFIEEGYHRSTSSCIASRRRKANLSRGLQSRQYRGLMAMFL